MLSLGPAIDQKQLLALLALGAQLTASRAGPFPFRYVVALEGDTQAVDEIRVRELVEARLLKPSPQGPLWDRIRFDVVGDCRLAAFRAYTHGFGRCRLCGAVVGAMPAGDGIAVRHNRAGGGRMVCEGGGKALEGWCWPDPAGAPER